MGSEVQNWAGGFAAIIATVLIQLSAQLVLLRVLAGRAGGGTPRERLGAAARLSLVTVLVLLFSHLAQVGIWAVLYHALGELGSRANAIYFSLASYTTVGAAELELSQAHRTLGALEAGIGTLMFGWSAAILVLLVGLSEVGTGPRPREPR